MLASSSNSHVVAFVVSTLVVLSGSFVSASSILIPAVGSGHQGSIIGISSRRDLQNSIACLASGSSDFYGCCPNYLSGADPDDGVCTLLTCLELGSDMLSLRSNCACDDIVSGCEQVAPYSSIVGELPDMCVAVSSCCTVEDGGTSNENWDNCMTQLGSEGNYTLPDFSTIIPGGIPVIETDDDSSASATTSATGATTTLAMDDGDMAASTSTVAASDATSVASATDAFEPPASVMCLATGLSSSSSAFLDCCPGPDPNDGVCTMLWCVNATDLSMVNDGCSCDMIKVACAQVSGFESMIANLGEACDAVSECCSDDGTTTDVEYGTCMTSKGVISPDLGSLVPGGLPDLGEMAATITTTESTALPEQEDTIATTMAPPAAETSPSTSGGGGGSAHPSWGGYFAVLVALIVNVVVL
ncbi:hypothetical protein ACHAXA_007375 [Cyclostephanos tholiformis]|uniref:Extracellular membrane protein CFEM domain-containing protein n=1 Tax=Cyclostephanos tholiformis TaxID=382380 RepID=A0ABD3RS71_9STRA